MGLLEVVVTNIVYAILWGITLASASAGLNLLWGVMSVVNVAHGSILLLGSYLIVSLFLMGVSPYIGVIIIAVFGVLFGLITYWLLLHKTVGTVVTMTPARVSSALLVMFGFGLLLDNMFYYIYGSEPKTLSNWYCAPINYISFGFITLRVNTILGFAISIIIIVMLHVFLTRTMIGKALNAVMQNAEAIALVGINPVKVKMVAAALSFAATIVAGFSVILYDVAVTPDTANVYMSLIFVVCIIGGLGALKGSIVGGIVVGVLYNLLKVLWSYAISPTLSSSLAFMCVFAIYLVVLKAKPKGIFGWGIR